jgi:hypothetical protein
MILSAILVILVVNQAASNDILNQNNPKGVSNQGYMDALSSDQQDGS